MRFGGNVPKKIQYKGFYELEYEIVERPWGITKDIDTGEKHPFCPIGTILAYEGYNNKQPIMLFERFYDDGRREIIFRHADYRDVFTDPKWEGTFFRKWLIEQGWKWNPEEEIIWKINPDGSAEYKRNHIPIEIQGQGPNACSNSGQVTRCIGNPSPGTQCYPYKFSAEGMKVFRAVASLYPNGFVDRSKYSEYPVWPQWYFPFEKGDSDAIRSWILNMSPAEALALYYTLVEYNGDEQNVYNGSWYFRNRKFVPEVTPEEFKRNGFWSLHQEMLIRAIWDLRTDLRKVRDPNTGQVIDGIIDYKLFQMPKRQGGRAQAAQAIAGVALGLMTLGASTGLQATLSMVDTAKGIMDMKSQADKMRAMQEFSAKVVGGYQAASDARNLIVPPPPPPKLTPAEEALSVKAEGKTPPAVTVTQGGTFPWLLAAGAAAALLLS